MDGEIKEFVVKTKHATEYVYADTYNLLPPEEQYGQIAEFFRGRMKVHTSYNVLSVREVEE